ncbi:hypothetical protein [Vibrio neonatus]|uniref:hypothetical protein n=1 Tax=Vibrio neonatus TaxID=278860 RepID=UPI0021C4638D|nr:hypothetical protein [Vibrio neonatus]
MAQVMQINTIAVPSSQEGKSYSIDFKGLIMHLVDILVGKGHTSKTYYASELSDHMQKDLGMTR